jgi:sugar-phosphatase
LSGSISVEVKGLLFDMDGVLISSIASVNRSWKKWAAIYNLPNPETFQIPHGVRAVEVMRQHKPDFTDDDVKSALRTIEDLEIEDVADLKVLDGVRDLLGSLPAERWTIVTSATRRLLLGRLKAAGLPYPDRLIAADDVVNGKPHPEPYMKGAEILGFSPSDCIVVEDAPAGAGAGKAAGSRVLGVLGTHEAEELYAAGATWVVKSLEGVKVTANADGLKIEFDAI